MENLDDYECYTILQMTDSSFPTGGFSHSLGSEAAVQHHQIKNNDDLMTFILSTLENTGSLNIPFIKPAHEEYKNLEKLTELDSLLNASLLNHVAHRASKQQGKSFLTTSYQVYCLDEISALKEHVDDGHMNGHLAIVFTVVCSALKIPPEKVARMFLYTSLRTVIASMVRLGKIGAVQAQHYQFQIQKLLNDIIKRFWMVQPEDAYTAFPLVETLQNMHDSMFVKMFYS